MRKPMMTAGVTLVAAVGIAACGSSSSPGGSAATTGSAAATGTAASAPTSGAAKTVALHQESGIGKVLVARSGMAIYTTDADTHGKIACTNSSGCTAFWKPVTVAGGKPHGAGNVGRLGTIKRPEGTMQLTVDGRPVYTFTVDSPGKVKGNNYTDHFAGTKFLWHALVTGGKAAPASGSSSSGSSASGSSAPTTSGGGGGAYGY